MILHNTEWYSKLSTKILFILHISMFICNSMFFVSCRIYWLAFNRFLFCCVFISLLFWGGGFRVCFFLGGVPFISSFVLWLFSYFSEVNQWNVNFFWIYPCENHSFLKPYPRNSMACPPNQQNCQNYEIGSCSNTSVSLWKEPNLQTIGNRSSVKSLTNTSRPI